jgi:hypothetical protein
MNLAYLLKEGRSEDCSAFYVAEKADLILCTESPKKSELTESADRSIARRAKSSSCVSQRAAAKSTLTNSAFS